MWLVAQYGSPRSAGPVKKQQIAPKPIPQKPLQPQGFFISSTRPAEPKRASNIWQHCHQHTLKTDAPSTQFLNAKP